MRISPAALAALLKGDIENAIVALTPGGIEAQEAQGQCSFVANNTLPIKCDYDCTREQIEQMGIVFGEPVDDLFIAVQLPEGWRKVATSHSLHSKLLDSKGRERAHIVYKAAFYDRHASIGLTRRFYIHSEPTGGWDCDNYNRTVTPFVIIVKDCGKVVWQSEEEVSLDDGYSARDIAEAKWLSVAKDWLLLHYPDWENPLAHWNE